MLVFVRMAVSKLMTFIENVVRCVPTLIHQVILLQKPIL
jgi:hypothetical protein